MAALAGLQIDNVLIELDANRAARGRRQREAVCGVLLTAGFEKQNAPKDYLIIDQTVHYHNEEKKVDIVALPTDDYRITVMVDYNNPALGSQHTGLFSLEKEFVTDFAAVQHVLLPARSGGAAQPGPHPGREPGQRGRHRGPRADRRRDQADQRESWGSSQAVILGEQRRREQPSAALHERTRAAQAAGPAWATSR